MEIILKQDVENLGHKFDIVTVKAGCSELLDSAGFCGRCYKIGTQSR